MKASFGARHPSRRGAIAFAIGAAGVLGSGAAEAHFTLESPGSWAEQDNLGSPQKSSPCGQDDSQSPATPTNVVADFQAGQTITVTIHETVFHPGHYRAVLSTTGRDGLPADPSTDIPGTCMNLPIQSPPVFPVLADGALPHTAAFSGPQSFEVTLPSGVTCTNCTLQVLEFMQADVGGSGNCFYHHCANIRISAETTGKDAGTPSGTSSSGCSCAVKRRASPSGRESVLLILLTTLAMVFRPSRRR